MNKDTIIMRKSDIIRIMETLPDDAIIIIPDWAKSYMRAINKRNKNPELSIKAWFAPDMFKHPDDIRGLMKLMLIPVFFIREENATSDFSQRFFDLANGANELELKQQVKEETI